MTILVAYTAQDSGTSALELASVLSRSTGEPLVVAVVVSTPLAAGVPDLIDGDYLGPLTDWGNSVLERARTSVPPDVEATFEVRQASSIPGGLLELSVEAGASAMVLGSTSKGALGRISIGSVTDRLLHAAPVPVLLAPRGYRSAPGARIRRVNIGFGGSTGGAHVAAAVGARLADTVGADLRAVLFAVRSPYRLSGSVEESADDLVIDRWAAQMKDTLLRQVGTSNPALSDRLARSLVVGEGVSWGRAIWDVDWWDGDLLVVGPSSAAPAARLFLGSRASKILRSAPVPVFMAPAPRDD